MKFTPEVIAALATLREHAENDFELHRIDVLEQDLTAPPQVEVIDDNHQKFNGVIFYKRKQTYYISQPSLHRVVWEYCVGDIPENYQIHHHDNNKSNNNLSNLQLLTNSEHQKLHNATSRSKKCICKFCGKDFISSSPTQKKFCSSKCQNAFRYESRREVRKCAVCGEMFSVYKSNKTKCCSRQCAAKITAQKNTKSSIEKVCPVCGEKFTVKPNKRAQIYCSNTCSNKAKGIRKKRPIVEKICAHCKKNFEVPSYYANKKYCSVHCYHEAKRKK